MSRKRVLSIQSHVVCGYVGNKASTFPLQLLGFEVDAINSVQLSNHTGYGYFKGQVLTSDELKVLFDGLKSNHLDNYSHLLTGYCGAPSFLKEIYNVLKELKEVNPHIVFVCDPVLGDDGCYYVPESLLPIYRDEIIPLADVITPNQFEAQLLTGVQIQSEADAIRAMQILHDKGPSVVVLSSLGYQNDKENLYLLASNKETPNKYIRMKIPKLDATFTGTGDLFTSMLLAWLHEHPNDLKLVCERAISAMQAILQKTLQVAKKLAGENQKPSPAQMELKLVQSVDIIRNPSDLFKAEVLISNP